MFLPQAGSLVSGVVMMNGGRPFKRWSIVGSDVQTLSFLGISFLRARCYKAHTCPFSVADSLLDFVVIWWHRQEALTRG